MMFENYSLKIIEYIKYIDSYKSPIYIIFFIFYFLIYYSTTVPKLADIYNIDELNTHTWFIIMTICINIIFIIGLIVLLVYYFKKLHSTLTQKTQFSFTLPIIFVSAIIIYFDMLVLNKKIIPITESSITKYIFTIFSSIFYILFIILFIYNINVQLNIEFVIALLILFIFFIDYVIIFVLNINKLYNQLKNYDLSTITVNCFDDIANTAELFTDNKNNDTINIIDNNIQIKSIAKQYGDNYLKTNGNIPISFYNPNNNNYQDLILADFYYPGSYYSYIANSPLNGTPNLEALKIAIVEYKARIIHLDVYSDKTDPYDPLANPVIRCENMNSEAKPLKFEDTIGLINKWAWITDNPNNLSYPFFLYLNLHYNEDNENLNIKVYEILLKFFSKYFIDKKYSFSGRNNTFPISMASMKDCLGKIIIITSRYPTKTVLDELINGSTNILSNNFNIIEYKKDYIKYDKIGISQDNDKTTLLNNSKSNLNFYYTLPNKEYKNDNQAKAGLFNPSFQDCAQYGIQGTLMYLFLPDENLNKWKTFFKNKNNMNPVLKEESLRLVKGKTVEIIKQDPVTGLQKPQKYCVVPGLISTEKSNLSGGVTNSSC